MPHDEPERKSSLKGLLALILLLAAGWAGGYYWWHNRLSTYRSPLGFEVDLPSGWTARSDKGNTLIAGGPLPGGGKGTARGNLIALDPADLRAGLTVNGPNEFALTEIGGSKAALAVYDDGEDRCLEVVIAGKESIRFTLRCGNKIFVKHRSLFEKSARSIRWLK